MHVMEIYRTYASYMSEQSAFRRCPDDGRKLIELSILADEFRDCCPNGKLAASMPSHGRLLSNP